MMQLRAISPILFLQVVTSHILLPNNTFNKNVKEEIWKETYPEVTVRRLPRLNVDYFWLKVTIVVASILCAISICWYWCEISSGRKVLIIIITYWNHFIHRFTDLFLHFRRRRSNYDLRQEEQEREDVV